MTEFHHIQWDLQSDTGKNINENVLHIQFQVLAEVILTLLSNLPMPKGMLFIFCEKFQYLMNSLYEIRARKLDNKSSTAFPEVQRTTFLS